MAQQLTPTVDESKPRKTKRVFPLPDITTIFPTKMNDLNTSCKVETWVQMVMKYSLISGLHFKSRVESGAITAAHFYPLCGEDRYEYLLKIMALLFAMDDHTECYYGDGKSWDMKNTRSIWNDAILALRNISDPEIPIDLTSVPPYIHYWHSIITFICRALNQVSKKRFLAIMEDYCDGNIEESEALAKSKPFNSAEEMLKIRRKAAAIHVAFALCEYADKVAVTEEEWEDQVLKEFMFQSCEAIIYCNDIMSFEKEWLDEKKVTTRMVNIVAVMANIDKISIAKAMEFAGQEYRRIENKMNCLKEQLLSRDSISEDLKTFINGVTYVVGGNYKAGVTLDRYNLLYGHDGLYQEESAASPPEN